MKIKPRGQSAGPSEPEYTSAARAQAGSARSKFARHVPALAAVLAFALLVLLTSVVVLPPPEPPPAAPVSTTPPAAPVSTTPPAAPADKAVVDPDAGSSLLFSIPIGDNGIRYFGEQWTRLAGFAVTEDRSFWIGDVDNRLLRYSSSGSHLRTLALPAGVQYLADLQLHESGFWILNLAPDSATVYRIRLDGSEEAAYRVPPPLDRGLRGLVRGPAGEVLLLGSFMNLFPPTPGPGTVPDPIATQPIVVEEHFRSLWQLVDRRGNLDPRPVQGLLVEDKLYNAHPTDVPWRRPTTGQITAGEVRITLAVSNTLAGLRILHVNADESFYVLSEEIDEQSPYPLPPRYNLLYHYGADGRLLGRARAPGGWQYLAAGPGGEVYALVLQPHGLGWEPDRVEVRRLSFLPPARPLPALPALTPSPTAYIPSLVTPASGPDPSAASTHDLVALAHKAEMVAHARIVGSNNLPGARLLQFEVRDWLKQSSSTARTFFLYVSDEEWNLMPQSFRTYENPASSQHLTAVLFLNGGRVVERFGATYELTEGRAGVFLIYEGTVFDPGLQGYEGWPLEKLSTAIRAVQPTPTAPAELVALLPRGDDLQLTAWQGALLNGQWVNPSALTVLYVADRAAATHLVHYTSSASIDAQYLVDVGQGSVHRLTRNRDASVSVRADGKMAVVIERPARYGDPLEVRLLDVASQRQQTVIAFGRDMPQWSGAAEHSASLGTTSYAHATWVGEQYFALTLAPRDDRARLYGWGKLLLVDLAARRVGLLAGEGQVVATLGDGTLLLRQGWIDGPLLALAPPYDTPPNTIKPAGDWTTAWSASPDGRKVAWLEMALPPGDWSRRPPPNCCVPGVVPVPRAITIWDSGSQRLRRTPISGFTWSQPGYTWLQDDRLPWLGDTAVLYTRPAEDNPAHTSLYRLGQDAPPELLARHDWSGHVTAAATGADGSLYYMITGQSGEKHADLVHRRVDGGVETICAGIPPGCYLVGGKMLISAAEAGITIQDLQTGALRRGPIPLDPWFDNVIGIEHTLRRMISPHGDWLVMREADYKSLRLARTR